jgi:MoaA/NifB/PqqE/SkfB family radical SAM enzyme
MVPTINGLHLELTNICTLKCPGCARTQFLQKWDKHWKNHYVDVGELDRFLDVDLSGKRISMCGNYGDPIYHPNFFELVDFFKQKQAIVSIVTNGSYKAQAWWEQLCHLLDSNDTITFSVDGSPDNFTKYRVNADWESIEVGMRTVGNTNINSIWKYIPFNYNAEFIEDAQSLSKELGIKDFRLSPSDRFDEHTNHLIPATTLIGCRKNDQDRFKQNKRIEVDPECTNGKTHYISADGYYSPCCYSADHRFRYKTVFGKEKHLFDIRNYTLSQILTASKTIEFYDSIVDAEPTVCQFNCPKIS